MKKLILFSSLIFMSISFMGNYVESSHEISKTKSCCPYLNKLMESSGMTTCPYLEEHKAEIMNGECPYLKGMQNGACEECPYLKGKEKSATKVEIHTPPIEMIST